MAGRRFWLPRAKRAGQTRRHAGNIQSRKWNEVTFSFHWLRVKIMASHWQLASVLSILGCLSGCGRADEAVIHAELQEVRDQQAGFWKHDSVRSTEEA